MIVGTTVTSPDAPGAVGVVTRRVDSDDGVALLVNWILADGHTALIWHREHNLTRSDTRGTEPRVTEGNAAAL